jgi:hypothetical protein
MFCWLPGTVLSLPCRSRRSGLKSSLNRVHLKISMSWKRKSYQRRAECDGFQRNSKHRCLLVALKQDMPFHARYTLGRRAADSNGQLSDRATTAIERETKSRYRQLQKAPGDPGVLRSLEPLELHRPRFRRRKGRPERRWFVCGWAPGLNGAEGWRSKPSLIRPVGCCGGRASVTVI